MSAVTATISEGEMDAARAKPAQRNEGARLGFRLTLPAQILVLFIAVFPLLMQLYISVTDWSPLSALAGGTPGRCGTVLPTTPTLPQTSASGAL
jgi:multiple sugar transport system permease protein